jgi:hypothetical protein
MRFCLLTMSLLACALTNGCGPQVSREELGQVEFEVPKVPGASQPYQLPDFSQPYQNGAAEAAEGKPAG